MTIDILKSKKLETPENFVLSFLTGLEESDMDIRNSIFYYKDNNLLFELGNKNRILYVNYKLIWSILESKYNLTYTEIQTVIKNVVEENVNWGSVTPFY